MRCPDCNVEAVLRKNSSFLYNGKDYGPIWICGNFPKCESRVSAHRSTLEPMGGLANTELRNARRDAHRVFDTLWKHKKMSRNGAYKWLSKAMGISQGKCHIGNFSVAQCQDVHRVVLKKLRSL